MNNYFTNDSYNIRPTYTESGIKLETTLPPKTDYERHVYELLDLAYEIEDQPSETDFVIFDGDSQIESIYTREEKTSATNPKYQYDLQYEKQFRNIYKNERDIKNSPQSKDGIFQIEFDYDTLRVCN